MTCTRGYDTSPPAGPLAMFPPPRTRCDEPPRRDLVAEIAAEITELATVTRDNARQGWERLAPYFWWINDADQMAADEITRTLDEITDLVIHGINHYRATPPTATTTAAAPPS